MAEFVEAARQSIRASEQELEKLHNRLPINYYLDQRAAVTEQWLKLAAIERGLNPFQPGTNPTEDTAATNGQRIGGGW